MIVVRWMFGLLGVASVVLGALSATRPDRLYQWRRRRFGAGRARATPVGLIRERGFMGMVAGAGLIALAVSSRPWS